MKYYHRERREKKLLSVPDNYIHFSGREISLNHKCQHLKNNIFAIHSHYHQHVVTEQIRIHISI